MDRILDFVGSYYLKLNGRVDAIVFAGGIGERSQELRKVVSERVLCLGFVAIDGARNSAEEVKRGGVIIDIGSDSTQGAEGKKILVCKTDEQLEMARECALEEKFWE